MIATINKKNIGYKIWEKILSNELNVVKVINELKTSNLQTRGGFSFISGLSAVDRNDFGQKYIICNAEESEPGTFKDRDIILSKTEELIEGLAISGFIIGATVGYIYLKKEFKEQFEEVEQAIKWAYKHNLLGKNIKNSNISFDLYTLHGAGRYITGEFTAILEAIEGKKSCPRIKPPLPSRSGLYGFPTAIVNVETIVMIPIVLGNAADRHLDLNYQKSNGYKVFSISGHVNKPGNYEIPIGTKFSHLLKMAGGIKNNKDLKAVLPGGLSSPVLPKELIIELALEHDTLLSYGTTLGSGGIIIMDENTCMVEVLELITKFYMNESCGKCSPCREGTIWIHKIVNRILLGQGTLKDLGILDHIADNIYGKNICALGDLAAMSVKSFIKHFRSEFIKKIQHGS